MNPIVSQACQLAAASFLLPGGPITRALISGIGAGITATALKNHGDDAEEREFTVQEASEVLGISTYTIKRKIANHEISATKKGNKFMIADSELKRYSAATKKSGIAYGSAASAFGSLPLTGMVPEDAINPDSPEEVEKLIDILKDAVKKKDLEISMAELDEQEPNLSDEQKLERKKAVLNLKIEKTDLEAHVKMMELRLDKLKLEKETDSK